MSNHITYHVNEDQIGILTFDREGSSANIFDHDTLEQLIAHIGTIEADTSLKGLILISAKPKIFIAGADINAFSKVDDPEALREIARVGQDTFARISDLKIPTVAAIHGQALGGGCEIALACDYRLASDSRDTKIGLPEVNLGILPAWGGSYRLPRLIGLPIALDIILGGKRLAPYPALKKGLVDQLCPREHFIRIATSWIAKGKPHRKLDWKTTNPLSKMIIRSKVRPMLQKKTNGHYPAPFKALDVCLKAVTADRATAFKLEQDALVELLQTPVCQHLVRIFFLQERAKKVSVCEDDVPPIDTVLVVGAGVMGAGIAQWSAARGKRVILKDINTDALQKGMAAIGKVFKDAVKRHVFTKTEAQTALDHIYPTARDVPFKDVDIIIEAATENMALKKKIFAGLDAAAGPQTILATNTSALSISELAETTSDPGRVVGIHYFNPVHKMQLVEVVRGKQTRPDVLQRAIAFVQQSGKLPVVVNDSPGFL
ncbi:MAG: 3-hydroxyacyl-CoA dehydrogenase/enoyl-CoA hydratase/3-hydroxybutyryl-CoA epimerase, partial [Kiritimatiellia bacterium]